MPTTDVLSGDPPSVNQLRAALGAACGNHQLFVLLDGARIPKLWVMLRELKAPHWCLFRESPKENLAHVAPFLAHCEIAGDLIFWLGIQEQALEAALFIVVGAGVQDLYRHLRRFLLVLNSAGQENYLRFYDPRVLQPFLASSTPAEKQQFFGPVRSFLAYDADASLAAGAFLLRQWPVPQTAPEGSTRPPSAIAKFQLSKEHEAEFSRDTMERYDQRCAAFLRHRYSGQLAGKTEAELRALVDRAKELGPALNLTSGRDVTVVAELLVLGLNPDMKNKLENIALRDRPRAARLLRDRLAFGRPEPQTVDSSRVESHRSTQHGR
ncbi:MAG TPA: DUF4123 domain-containing protein [Bryobacteraceae bacterium]|nr:DUF4123 domain-containing protein [Bryobacteraceae bacterium]